MPVQLRAERTPRARLDPARPGRRSAHPVPRLRVRARAAEHLQGSAQAARCAPGDLRRARVQDAALLGPARAGLAARRFGTEHSSQTFSGKECIDLLPEAVAQLDEPFADPSFLPTLLLSKFTRRHVKVALAGDGGDELCAGYDPFLAHRPGALFARLPHALRSLLAHAVQRLPASPRNMSLQFRLTQFVRGLDAPP